MAKKTRRLADELSDREFSSRLEQIGRRDHTQKMEFERHVLALFNNAPNWKAIRLPGGGDVRPGDLLVTRADLGQERRYIIDCTMEVNPGSIKRAYEGLRYHIDRSSKRPPDFDE